MQYIADVEDVKTELDKLLALAEAGDTVVLARENVPVVQLVLVKPPNQPVFGLWREKVGGETIPWEAFSPLTEAELAEWGLD